MGAERAHHAGRRLIDAGAKALVSWGSAAALDATLAPGALFLPTRIIARSGEVFRVDAEWHARIYDRAKRSLAIHTGAIVEATHTLSNAQEKRALAAQSGARAADMESAALAALAREARVPFIAVRAIADDCALAVPAPFVRSIAGDGRVRIMAAVAGIALRPWLWPTALRLDRAFGAACGTLRQMAHELQAAC